MRCSLLLAAFVFALAAPARAQTTPAAPAPAADTTAAFSPAGAYTYAIDTPGGLVSGVLAFTETDGVVAGTMSRDGSEGAQPLADVTRLGRALSFAFEGGEYGRIATSITFAPDGTFAGTMTVMGFGVPIAGARKTDG